VTETTTTKDQRREHGEEPNGRVPADRVEGGSQPGARIEAADDQERGVMRRVWVGGPQPDTTDHRPVIVELPTRWRLELPRQRARTALVVVTRRTRPALLGSPDAPSRWGFYWQHGTLYEVDLGLHHASFDLALPSSGDTFDFRAEVSVEWRVVDAVTVVRDNVVDIREALKPAVRYRLSRVTREFAAGRVIAAERAVGRGMSSVDVGRPYGLATTIRVRLVADEGATEHAESRREVQHKIEMEELEQAHRRLTERHEAEIIEARMALYRLIIDSGDVEQFALQLARNPSGVESVVQLVREYRKDERRQVTDFITRLLESGAVDRWDLDDHVRVALEWLRESTNRTVQTGEAHIPRHHRRPVPERSGSVVEEPVAEPGEDPGGERTPAA
jgi:hypothetical protein